MTPEQMTLEGIDVQPEPKPKKARRPRVYIYEDAEPSDNAFLLKTPDLMLVRELLQDLKIHAYWSGLKGGLLIKPKYLSDLVAACHAHRWYVRIKDYEPVHP